MGSYITTTTIYTDKATRINTSTMAPTLLSCYIDDAESVINGYIAKRYDVASVMASRPPLLQKIAKDLTTYFVLTDQYTKDNHNQNDWLARKYDTAFSLLENIANDKMRLNTSAGAEVAQPTDINMACNTTDYPLTINMDDGLQWSYANNLLRDINDSRSLSE